MRLFAWRMLPVGCWLGLLAVIGCGGSTDKGVPVRGRLLQNGKPAQVDMVGVKLPPGESGRMRVMFYPVKSDKDIIANESGEILTPGGEMASVEADGSFNVAGAKPGKYRIVITHIHPSSGDDLLKGVYDEQRSKVTRDVVANQEIIIDLAKPSG